MDLVDAMVAAADNDSMSGETVQKIEAHACLTSGSCSGMFAANSMNCRTEAQGLSLPGKGSTVATHFDRKRPFVVPGHPIVDIIQRHDEPNDASVLSRAIATKDAVENAMMPDIARGGSTNTVLHIRADTIEGEVDSPWMISTGRAVACRCCAKLPLRNPMCIWKIHSVPGDPVVGPAGLPGLVLDQNPGKGAAMPDL